MRSLTAVLTFVLVAGLSFNLAQEKKAQEKKAPDKLTFKSKMGNVVFDHAKHIKDAKNECKTCHEKLWPQSSTAPFNYKDAMHKTAEAKHTSCAFCHHAGGASFAAAGNCNKCHVKAGAKG